MHTDAVAGALDADDTTALAALLDADPTLAEAPLPDKDGATPLQVACSAGRTACGHLLLDRGVDPEGRTPECDHRPIDLAIWEGHRDLAERLAATPGVEGSYWIAAGLGDLERVRQGPEPDHDAERYAVQVGALLLAAINGRLEVVAHLVEEEGLGPDDSLPGEDFLGIEATPLHWAAGWGRLDVVTYLLDAGADLAAVDTSFGNTPLGWARYGDHSDVVAELRGRGAPEGLDPPPVGER